MKIKGYLVAALACLLIISVQAQELNVTFDLDDQDGIFLNRRTAEAFLMVHNPSEKKVGFETYWEIKTDDWQPLKSLRLYHEIEAGDSIRVDCPMYRFPSHGFFRYQVNVSTADWSK